MRISRKSLWASLHLIAIIAILLSLGSGLRIAILDYPFLLSLNNFLPQGNMQELHIYAACAVTLLSISYFLLLVFRVLPNTQQFNKKKALGCFHWLLAWCLRIIMPCLLISGWLLYADISLFSAAQVKRVHLVSVIALLAYVLLHGMGYYLELGTKAIRRMVAPIGRYYQTAIFVSLFVVLVFCVFQVVLSKYQQKLLSLPQISNEIYIEIDGRANEKAWEKTTPVVVNTYGGANFVNGETPVSIRAMHNGQDAFFLFRWRDATKSLKHLPLIKTAAGWQVQQDGFYDFDERTYYEDKFATILSDNCALDAANTAHLGAQPLKEKPQHWTGKGYHYTKEGVVDLWQWKAVRTNSMRLMDDNYIGLPAEVRAGERRYTAGYQQDGYESGSYKMNWLWYTPDGVTPKRIPIEQDFIKSYQEVTPFNNELSWVIPWFGSRPYNEAQDDLPSGTILPSILYSSNQFEGDRAHVRAFARWQDGYWTLEVFRRLDTKSDKDVAIKNGVCLWVAAFDHAQVAHTRHLRPIQLVLDEIGGR